jgi:hypothetical protein
MKANTKFGLCSQCRCYTEITVMVKYNICMKCYKDYCDFSYGLGLYIHNLLNK